MKEKLSLLHVGINFFIYKYQLLKGTLKNNILQT